MAMAIARERKGKLRRVICRICSKELNFQYYSDHLRTSHPNADAKDLRERGQTLLFEIGKKRKSAEEEKSAEKVVVKEIKIETEQETAEDEYFELGEGKVDEVQEDQEEEDEEEEGMEVFKDAIESIKVQTIQENVDVILTKVAKAPT